MGQKNKLSDLNNHLFEMLERLNNDDLKGEELKEEIIRGKAMTEIAGAIVENAKVELSARRLAFDCGADDTLSLPEFIKE